MALTAAGPRAFFSWSRLGSRLPHSTDALTACRHRHVDRRGLRAEFSQVGSSRWCRIRGRIMRSTLGVQLEQRAPRTGPPQRCATDQAPLASSRTACLIACMRSRLVRHIRALLSGLTILPPRLEAAPARQQGLRIALRSTCWLCARSALRAEHSVRSELVSVRSRVSCHPLTRTLAAAVPDLQLHVDAPGRPPTRSSRSVEVPACVGGRPRRLRSGASTGGSRSRSEAVLALFSRASGAFNASVQTS